MKKIILLFIISLLFTSCNEEEENTNQLKGLVTEKAMVVSARAEASKIGTEILNKGGNAFDAMMATELALAVSYPVAGNIGGGGFMVYRKNDGEIGALDYREKAPLAASKDMYLDTEGNIIKGKSTSGATAVGVPGTIAGVFKAQEKFGVLSVKEVLTPVIALAKKGVLVTKKQEKRILKHQKDFKKVNKDTFIFLDPWKEGDTIKYIALANTLERILKNGRDEFLLYQHSPDFSTYLNDWNSNNRIPVVTDNYGDLELFVNGNYPYSKGSLVLNMLRKEIGESKWEKVIKKYVAEYSNKIVSTKDFIKVVNAVSDEPMNWFFDQWIYGIGHPKFKIETNYNVNENQLYFTVKQTQKLDSLSKFKQAPFFQGKMVIEIDGVLENIRLEPKPENTFVFKLETEPKFVNFDFQSSWIKEVDFEKINLLPIIFTFLAAITFPHVLVIEKMYRHLK